MPEFGTWDTYQAWLEEQPHDAVIAMAARSALRSVPGLFQGENGFEETVALTALRAILISAVAGTGPSAEIWKAALSNDAAARAAALSAEAAALSAARAASLSADVAGLSDDAAIRAAVLSADSAALSAAYSVQADQSVQSARAAADSALATARSAAGRDTALVGSIISLLAAPLWAQADGFAWPRPDALAEISVSRTEWKFWARWYEGFLSGNPLDWELQKRIALIPDAEWEAGPERIAEVITGIEDEMRAERIKATQQQAAALKARSVLMVTVASGLSAQIGMALAEWATVSNALPEELEPLERFQGLCDGIAAGLKADASEDEIAQLIVAMAGTIGELNRRLAATRAELRASAARPSPAELRRAGFHTRLGERTAELITSKWLWGGVFAGASLLLGPAQTDAIGSLGQCYEDMIGPDAIYPPEMWAVPDYSEV